MKYIFYAFLCLTAATILMAQDIKNEYPFMEKYSFDGSDC